MSGYYSGSIYGPGGQQSPADFALAAGSQQVGATQLVYDYANSDFKEIMYVQAGPSIANNISANAALKFISPGVVDMVSGAGDICDGCNDVSGFSGSPLGSGVPYGTGIIINKGYYFWMTIRGAMRPLLDASTAAGPLQTGSATAGQLQAWATTAGATFQQTNIRSLVLQTPGGVTNCRIS